MSNKFIAFLGTNIYKRCNYCFSDNTVVKGVRFIQEAVISHACKDWNKEDEILVFLTKDAEKKNWKDGGHNKEKDEYGLPINGLETQLKTLNLKARIRPVTDVPEGNSEKEIWDIFSIVERNIEKGDTLWFDITHGFRSLPMLVMVLLQYLNTLKNINVGGIFYGAFETLGAIKEVESFPLVTRNAPVFNLTAFHAMQTWAAGVDVFNRFGDAGRIKEALREYCKPLLKESKGKNPTAIRMRGLAEILDKTGLLFGTARGSEIVEGGKFREIKDIVGELRDDQNVYPPLKTLMETISAKFADFRENDIVNGFTAVKWCIDHDLIQQGITLLQETIITWICEENGFNWQIKDNRELVSCAFNIIAQKIPSVKWNKLSSERSEDSIKIQESIGLKKDLTANYSRLSELRNDINHSGYRDNAKGVEKFKSGLKEIFEDVMKIVNGK